MLAIREISVPHFCRELQRQFRVVEDEWYRETCEFMENLSFTGAFPSRQPICFSSKQTSLRVELNFARTVALRSEESNVCSFSMLMRFLDIIHLDYFLGKLFENQYYRKANKLVWKRFLFGCVANRGAFSVLQLQHRYNMNCNSHSYCINYSRLKLDSQR